VCQKALTNLWQVCAAPLFCGIGGALNHALLYRSFCEMFISFYSQPFSHLSDGMANFFLAKPPRRSPWFVFEHGDK
jgi:hypothetical protein